MEFALHFLKPSGTAFLAGGLSLVSQIVGLRIVTREVSASELTVASILVCALGGLSLGAALFGRAADRKQSRCNSALGLANALLFSAAVVVLLFALFGQKLTTGIGTFDLPEILEVVCFLMVTVVPINVLLGGIVPVLTKTAMDRSADNVQTAFGWIYAFETLGAAFGSWIVVFVAVPAIGSRMALIVTAAIVLAWTVMMTLLRNSKAPTTQNDTTDLAKEDTSQQNDIVDSGKPLHWLILIAAMASSCASLGMELVWQRYFAVILGSDSHSYAVVAAMFLIGNAIGAALTTKLFRFQNASLKLYQWQLLLIGGAILASAWSLGFWFRLETMQWALGWLEQYPLYGRLAMASAVLLLPAILIGSALPVLVKLWAGGGTSVSTRAGQVYAFVIVGNIVGVLVSASWLVPSFGLRVAAVVLSAVCIVASLGIGFIGRADGTRKTTFGGRILTGCYWLVIAGAIGLGIHVVNSPLRPGVADNSEWILDHYVEHASHTVAVTHASDVPSNKRLMIDGVMIGEAGGGVDEKQQMLAHLPFIIADAKQAEVLTIGLGTGILAGELAANEQVESVTCVELSAAVIEASDWFAEENRNVLQNEKLKLVHGDGVRFLRNADSAFDVIVSDGKTRPGAASNLPFFSKEYYRICAEKLSEQGVFVQWVSLHCDRNELETILVTFCSRFPYGHIAIAAPDSVYLVGTRSPVFFNSDAIENYLQKPSNSQLRNYSWASEDDFLSMYWLDQTVVAKSLGGIAPNTFDRPVLEKFSWDSYGHSLSQRATQQSAVQHLLQQDSASSFNGEPLDQGKFPETASRLKRGRSAANELLAGEAIRIAREEDWLDRSTVHFKNAIQQLPNINRQYHVVQEFRKLAYESNQNGDANAEYSALINVSELNAANASEEFRIGSILDQSSRLDLAVDHYDKAVRLSDQHPQYLIGLGEAMLRLQKLAVALSRFDLAIERSSNPDSSEADRKLKSKALLLKGITLRKLGRPEARKTIDKALAEDPELYDTYLRYGP